MKIGLLKKQMRSSSCAGSMSLARGFTLIEVMVVVVILAIMLSLAVPSMSRLLEGNRLEARATELAASIHLARMEAMKRGPGARVSVTPNSASDWAAGWTVFVDTTTDANGGVPPAGTALTNNPIVQVAEAFPNSLTVSTGALSYVSFVGSGDAMVTATGAADKDFDGATGGYLQGVVRMVSGTQSRCIKLVPPGLVDVLVNPANCP
jgi:type IV fimbrial biogenesis protein FimT